MSNLLSMKIIVSRILEGTLKALIDNVRNRNNNDEETNTKERSYSNFIIILISSSNKASQFYDES